MCPNRHSPDYPIEDSVHRHSNTSTQRPDLPSPHTHPGHLALPTMWSEDEMTTMNKKAHHTPAQSECNWSLQPMLTEGKKHQCIAQGSVQSRNHIPDSKVHRTNKGPIWGQQVPGGPHVGPMNFAIWDASHVMETGVIYKD